MIDRDAEWILNIFSMYEKISRKSLAYNIGQMLDRCNLPKKGRYSYLGKLCGLERETIHSWLGPNREAKMPLKYVALICYSKNFSLTAILTPPKNENEINLRISPKRNDSYEKEVIALYKSNPSMTVYEIAAELNIADVTVRRHLKNYQESILSSDSDKQE